MHTNQKSRSRTGVNKPAATSSLRVGQEILISRGAHKPAPARIVKIIDGESFLAIRFYHTSSKWSLPFRAHVSMIRHEHAGPTTEQTGTEAQADQKQ